MEQKRERREGKKKREIMDKTRKREREIRRETEKGEGVDR